MAIPVRGAQGFRDARHHAGNFDDMKRVAIFIGLVSAASAITFAQLLYACYAPMVLWLGLAR